MSSREKEDEYIALQREILYAQGQNWFLNIHGWNDRNQTVPICEWEGITCHEFLPNVVIGIDLVGYNMAGPISPTLGLLSALTHIDLSENYVSGKIPKEISTLPSLVSLKLNHNRLSGRIPHFVSHDLKELNLSHNFFDGINYAREDYMNRKKENNIEYMLDIFDASHNALKGYIPDSIDVLINLKILDLSFNELYGTIPSSIGNLKELKSLILNDNNLVGTIPTSLTQSDLTLYDLELSQNDLSGSIPTGLANIRYLKNLHINGNKLTGTVPSSLCNLDLNEELFQGDDNNENEEIVRDGCTSVACPMNTASLTGVYPCRQCGTQGFDWYVGHIGKCLHMNEKVLLDKIYEATNGPSWREGTGWTLSAVDKCAYSGVECNASDRVIAINLSDHGLSGTIPQEFGMFRYLQSLDLSDNDLTGYLPSDFRFLPLENLDVSGNKIDGNVPPMLCLTGDINGNGMNGDFNCDIIACPSGKWSPIGRASPVELHGGKSKQEHTCKPCKKSHTFLGSRYCGGAVRMGSEEPGWIHLGTGTFITVLTLPLVVACTLVACVTGVVMKRRSRSIHQKDGTIADETEFMDTSVRKTPPIVKKNTRSKLIEKNTSTRTEMVFNYGHSSSDSEDEDDVLVRNIGHGLPYVRDLHRTNSLVSMKEDQIDDEMTYPSRMTEIERTSFVSSHEGSELGSTTEGMVDTSNHVESSAVSTHSSKSRSSRGASSRKSQNDTEMWLDVPMPDQK